MKRQLINTAHLSPCRRYRYALWRSWDDSLPRVMFVGLNPSTADESLNDPTLVRCMNFARSWGYGGVTMANLFALRSTDPRYLRSCADPIGKQNNRWLKKLASEAGLIVAAWGNDGKLFERSTQVRKLLAELHCLAVNKSGEPAHPLYQKASCKPLPLTGRSR